jgi:DNA-directed RNA polymerase specialized sigma24 family protein
MRAASKAPAYTTSSDFRRVFTEDSENIHLLSFLLTADQTKADECFVSGLENCSKKNDVFRDWAHSWARRTIILTAVRMLRPRLKHSTAPVAPGVPANCEFARSPEVTGVIGNILGLEDFDRFIFVMSVLERYSDQDCSVLLDCSRQDVRESRARALQQVAGAYSPRPLVGPVAWQSLSPQGVECESNE